MQLIKTIKSIYHLFDFSKSNESFTVSLLEAILLATVIALAILATGLAQDVVLGKVTP